MKRVDLRVLGRLLASSEHSQSLDDQNISKMLRPNELRAYSFEM